MERRHARIIAAGLLLAGLVAVVDQALSLTPVLLRTEPVSPAWRVQLFGAVAARLTPLLLADALLLVGAAVLANRALLRGLGWAHALVGVSVLGATLIYGLDAIEVRRGIPLEARPGFTLAVVRIAALSAVAAGFALWLGLSLPRARNLPGGERPPARPGRGILVGTRAGPGGGE